jgi:hypothetical protein
LSINQKKGEKEMDIREFLFWEGSSRDTIDFKKVYVDISNDLIAGLLLSQIVYWHLPSKETGKTKLRVEKEGFLWIAKGREDWYEEIRITAKQYDRAIKMLEKLEIVEVKTFKFNSNPTKHVRLLWDKFLKALEYQQTKYFHQNSNENSFDPLSGMVIPQRGKRELPKGEEPIYPKVNNDIDLWGKSLTENTDKDFEQRFTNKELKENSYNHHNNSLSHEIEFDPFIFQQYGFTKRETNTIQSELYKRKLYPTEKEIRIQLSHMQKQELEGNKIRLRAQYFINGVEANIGRDYLYRKEPEQKGSTNKDAAPYFDWLGE